MELRLLREHTGNYHSDTLQYRHRLLNVKGGEYYWSEWENVPIVDRPSETTEKKL